MATTASTRKKAFKPTIQGGFDFAHESGFYLGNWHSSVNWLSDFGGRLVLSGSVQGANKKDSYLLTTADGVDVFGDGSFLCGAQSQSVNRARFIVTLAKSF